MVDVLAAVGTRTGISSFYVSFVLAPLASNASELIAAFNYSLKKTSRTIVISFAALQVRISIDYLYCLKSLVLLRRITSHHALSSFSFTSVGLRSPRTTLDFGSMPVLAQVGSTLVYLYPCCPLRCARDEIVCRCD